jgi:outer membrane protein OmpA-like peptidoglycan-associated protein
MVPWSSGGRQQLLTHKLITVFLVLGCSTTSASEGEAVWLGIERDSAEWSLRVTVPHLWSMAALPPSPPVWTVELLCPSDSLRIAVVQPELVSEPAWEVLLCIDRSALATLSPAAVRSVIATTLSLLQPEDRLVVVQYRYRAEHIHTFTGEAVSAVVSDTLSILPAGGVAAPLHIAQGALEYCRSVPSTRRRALILLVEAPDKASFLVNAADVARTAQELDVPLFVVQVGLLGERSLWRAVAHHAGGAFFWIATPEPFAIVHRLRWLIRGLHTHYRLRFPAPPRCVGQTLRVRAEQLGIELVQPLADTIPQVAALRHTVCLFQAGDTSIAASYEPIVADLAQWLREHPEEVVELIGHSGQAEPAGTRATLAGQRAAAVRRRLLQLGVSPRQLRVRSAGSSEPVFYFERSVAQQLANARVEVRWLRPELFPYELVVGSVPSEEQALHRVELWEQRGFSAYYEPIVSNGEIAYRVKLWGFATREQAELARRRLAQRYGVRPQLY